jgi:two-component system response regulator FixJ
MSRTIAIALVDDDEAVLDSLRLYFVAIGHDVAAYPLAESLLEALAKGFNPDCIVSDIRMPGLSGLDLQGVLTARGITIPLILITGHGDVEMAVGAIKAGAYDFIEKPFDDHRLLCQVLKALEERPAAGRPSAATAERLEHLSEREREVLERVLAGKPSGEVAAELSISVKTVEFHRARIMQKLGVRSAAELFRVCLAG